MIYCDGDSEGYPRFDLPAGSLNIKELCLPVLYRYEASGEPCRRVQRAEGICVPNLLSYSSQFTLFQSLGATHNLGIPKREPRDNTHLSKCLIPGFRLLGRPPEVRPVRGICPPQTFGGREQGLFLTFDELPPSVKNITTSLCEYSLLNMLKDLMERSRCNLKSLETVILLPQSSTPDEMLGPSRSNSSDEIYDGHYRAGFIEACDEIEKTIQGVPFDLHIHSEVWNDYQMGVF